MISTGVKTAKLLIWLLPLALILWLFYMGSEDSGLRVTWVETTRHKLLLYDGPPVDLFQNRRLEQTFQASYPGLAQIDILFMRDGQTKKEQRVVFRLKESCDTTEDIVYLTPRLSFEVDLAFYAFRFQPVDESAGQTYCIVLEAPEATVDQPVRVGLSDGDLYPSGTLQIHNPAQRTDNRDSPQSLIVTIPNKDELPHKLYLPIILGEPERQRYQQDIGFQLRYRGFLLPTAQLFMARLTANKPYLLGEPWFYGGLLIVYVGLLVVLFYLARKTVQFDR